MKQEIERIDELYILLSELLGKDTSTEERMRDWYVDARHTQERLTATGGLGPVVPELIWHYLADADIRAKDPIYRDHQEAFMRAFLVLLKTGEVPGEERIRACLEESSSNSTS